MAGSRETEKLTKFAMKRTRCTASCSRRAMTSPPDSIVTAGHSTMDPQPPAAGVLSTSRPLRLSSCASTAISALVRSAEYQSKWQDESEATSSSSRPYFDTLTQNVESADLASSGRPAPGLTWSRSERVEADVPCLRLPAPTTLVSSSWVGSGHDAAPPQPSGVQAS